MKSIKRKKVLIFYANVGSGHVSASNAIASVYREKHNKYFVHEIDLFKESNRFPFSSSELSYQFVSSFKIIEKINNLLAHILNTKVGNYFFKKFINFFLFKTTYRIINNANPDLVISVHPLVTPALASVKAKSSDFYFVTVLTDLVSFMRCWVSEESNLLFSPTYYSTNKLLRYGAEKEKIVSNLFPIRPQFANLVSTKEIISKHSLKPDLPIILLTGGGQGLSSILPIVDIIKNNADWQIIVISGKDKSIKDKLISTYSDNSNIKILGYVKDMQNYINVADIVISKPGATSVIELLALDKKAIFTDKIGFQESGNAEYACEISKKMSIKRGDYSNIHELIGKLLQIPNSKNISSVSRSLTESYKIVKIIESKYKRFYQM